MEENGKPRARPGVTVTFKAFDEDGRLQMEVSNSQPYKGGYYFFQVTQAAMGRAGPRPT